MTKTVVLIRNSFHISDFGGGEKYPVMLGAELKKNGVHPIILSGHPKLIELANMHSLEAKKTPWLRLENFSGWKIILTPLYFLWQIGLSLYYLFLFKKIKPDIVHPQSRDDFIAASVAARLLKIPVIWTDHGDLKHVLNSLSNPIKNPIGKLVYFCMRFAQTVTSISHNELGLVLSKLPNDSPHKDKFVVIYNGIKARRFNAKKTRDNFIFAFVGRIVTDKGIYETIEAFNSLNQRATELWIIGDGKDKEKIKELTKNKHIKFFGHLKDPLPTLARADCLLAPSYHEALGLSIIEGLMLGLPVIATKVGGIPEIIADGINGLLVPPRDTTALANAMDEIITDPTLAKRLARQARQVYEQKFDLDNIVAKDILPLYNVETNAKTAN